MKLGKWFKEIAIGGLLIIAILVLLLIALYEYNPKISLAEVEKYKRTEKISSTLGEISTTDIANSQNDGIIRSYTISAKDLSVYAQSEVYEASRPDPFAALEDDSEYKADSQIDGGSVSGGGSSGGSTGYFNKTGKNK